MKLLPVQLCVVFSIVSALSVHADEKIPVNDYVAVIESGGGSGTGFLVADDDEVWLYTNEHVIRGGAPLKAKLMTGERLQLRELQIATDRDAARFKVVGQTQGLRISKDVFTIGNDIKVFGNSDGAGVCTYLGGTILGVGPVDVEVSAQFIPGNSGSPIIVDGKGVIAIATYLTGSDERGDWTKAGTRFAKVRRFGVRTDNVKWVSVETESYFKDAAFARSVRFCYDVMKKACFSKEILFGQEDSSLINVVDNIGMRQELRKIQKVDAEFIECFQKMSDAKEKARLSAGLNAAYVNETTQKQYNKKYAREYDKASAEAMRREYDVYASRAKALKNIAGIIKFHKTSIPGYKDLYAYYYDRFATMYKDFRSAHSSKLYQMSREL